MMKDFLMVDAQRILVVEDEPHLATLVSDYLRQAGYAPHVLDHGDGVVDWVRAHQPALVVLDWMLPGMDGLALCRALRSFSDVPLMMVTARVEEVDRLIGLEAGADDYVCKPFSPRELVARVKAILRRQHRPLVSPVGAAPASAAVGLLIDTATHAACWNGAPLDLTPAEYRLLSALATGRVLSRDQLLDCLHTDQRALNDRTVDSHIKNLRRKLELASTLKDPIRSIYGVGYRLEMG